jgi:diacylglycerol kinase (ATP)
MRVTLVYNSKAGEKAWSKKKLIQALESAGHQVEFLSKKQKKPGKHLLANPPDLVLIAGGDGTVEKVVFDLAGQPVPISVIPLGSANNIARSLGFVLDPGALIAGIRRGREGFVDLGLAIGPWGERPFIEGLGLGALARMMFLREAQKKQAEKQGASDRNAPPKVAGGLEELREVLLSYPVEDYHLNLDGRDYSGRYLLVEVLNIRSVGPNLLLAPKADPGDGRLDVVSVLESEREAFAEYLTERLDGRLHPAPFTVRRARHIFVGCQGPETHIDDEVWPEEDASAIRNLPPACAPPLKVEIITRPKAIRLRLPDPSGARRGDTKKNPRKT